MSYKRKEGWCAQAKPAINKLLQAGSSTLLKDYEIDLSAFSRYLEEANYQDYSYIHNVGADHPVFLKKALEHYISFDLLDILSDDVYIDVASGDSPFSQILHHLTGCTVYHQDLRFRVGIHGNEIGGDAGNMPLPDNFASALALHSSFEHFERDSDIRFLHEAARILKPGGKICIIEFFVADEPSIATDPSTWEYDPPDFDEEATVYIWKGWKNRFGRYYAPSTFKTRILDHLSGMQFTIYNIVNSKAVHPHLNVIRGALIEKNS